MHEARRERQPRGGADRFNRRQRRQSPRILFRRAFPEPLDDLGGRARRIDRTLTRAARTTTGLREPGCIVNRCTTQVALDHRVNESQVHGGCDIDRFRVEDELERPLNADQPRHALRAARARDDAEGDLRQAKARARERDAVVAGERDLKSAAEHRAVHRCEERNGQPLETVEQRPVRFLLGRAGELGYVRPREEGAARAHQYGAAHTGPRAEFIERAVERIAHSDAERVDRRIADSDDRDAVNVLDGSDGGGHRGSVADRAHAMSARRAEQSQQLLAAPGTESPGDPRLVDALQPGGALEHASPRKRQLEGLRAPIRGRRSAPHEAAPFEVVDHGDEIRALDPERGADLGLSHAVIAVDDGERRKLTWAQIELHERLAEIGEHRELRSAQHVPDAGVQDLEVETSALRYFGARVGKRRSAKRLATLTVSCFPYSRGCWSSCWCARAQTTRTSANGNSTVSEVPDALIWVPCPHGPIPLNDNVASPGSSLSAAAQALPWPSPRRAVVRRRDLRPHGHDAVRQHESRRAPDAGDQARPRAHRHAGEPRRRICGRRVQRACEPADLASRRHAQSPAHTRHRPADDGRRQRTDRARERVLAALRGATVRRHRRRGQRAGDLFDPCRLLPAGQASEGDRLHEFRIHVGHRARAGARRNPDRGARDDG